MTRKSKREVENAIEDLEIARDDTDWDPVIVHEDPETGEWFDSDGRPIEDHKADPLVVISRTLVMTREQAEREGREILGPAKDTPPENDAVRALPGDP